MPRKTVYLPEDLYTQVEELDINISKAARLGIKSVIQHPELSETGLKKLAIRERQREIDRQIAELEAEREFLEQKCPTTEEFEVQKTKMRQRDESADLMKKLNDRIFELDFDFKDIKQDEQVNELLDELEEIEMGMGEKRLEKHVRMVEDIKPML